MASTTTTSEPAFGHVRLRRWGVDASDLDVVVDLTHPANGTSCTHPGGRHLLSSLALGSVAYCPDLSPDTTHRVRDLDAALEALTSFEEGGCLEVEYVLQRLWNEPVAAAQVERAAVAAWRAQRAQAEARLATLLELPALPTPRASTYLHLKHMRTHEVRVLLEALYERLTPDLFVVPLKVADAVPGGRKQHARRLGSDTPSMVETFLALVEDGTSLETATEMARALEDCVPTPWYEQLASP